MVDSNPGIIHRLHPQVRFVVAWPRRDHVTVTVMMFVPNRSGADVTTSFRPAPLKTMLLVGTSVGSSQFPESAIGPAGSRIADGDHQQAVGVSSKVTGSSPNFEIVGGSLVACTVTKNWSGRLPAVDYDRNLRTELICCRCDRQPVCVKT